MVYNYLKYKYEVNPDALVIGTSEYSWVAGFVSHEYRPATNVWFSVKHTIEFRFIGQVKTKAVKLT